MGIEKFFNSIAKNKTIRVGDGIKLGLENKIDYENVYIDFNSIIYNIATNIEVDLNYLLYEIIVSDGKTVDKTALEIAEKWNYDIKKASVESYKQYFSGDFIDMKVLDMTVTYISNLCENILNPVFIKSIYIAVDGIPTMSKILEQKRRRYAGYIVSSLKKKIYEENVKKNNFDAYRLIYEQNKMSYDRGKIVQWSQVMTDINKLLTDPQFYNLLKEKCINLREVNMSTGDVVGEGEKKIMQHINENPKSESYLIFSPDADMIILALVVNNTLFEKGYKSTFGILRYNQQSEAFDHIVCDVLIDNIYNYVIDKLDDKTFEKTKVINDLSLLFTFFGNDFLPKLESIDVRSDFDTIINEYCKMLNLCHNRKRKQCNIVHYSKDDYKLSYKNFMDFLGILSTNEQNLLNNAYMANTYKNYGFLNTVFGTGILYTNIYNYHKKANSIFEMIKKDALLPYIVKEFQDDTQFMRQFAIIEGRKDIEQVDADIKDSFRDTIEKLLKLKNIYGQLQLRTYETSINSPYHITNIEKSMVHPQMKVSEYDREAYKLEKKLDQYINVLNAGDYDLGAVTLRFKDGYKMKVDRGIDNMIVYYKDFFKIDVSTENGLKQLDEICKDYLEGLFWIFDFYYNKNNSKDNYEHASIWMYKHHKAPLIADVYNYLKKTYDGIQGEYNEKLKIFNGKINKIFKKVASFEEGMYVPRDKFLNKLEHYMYVTPVVKQYNIPQEYESIQKQHTNIFPNLDDIVKGITLERKGHELIDCRRVAYLSKCHLLTVETISFEEYMDIMFPIRKTEYKLAEAPFNYKWMNGGGIKRFIKYYKKKYLQTGKYKYKEIYKNAKHVII
uniref:Xrn1 N-terminal domain-containing protein n=1 Tax=viral metagenome TaxID=1070528 RepID=A0A6C0ECE8_9ZZZZ